MTTTANPSDLRHTLVDLATMTVLGLVLAMIGPFGSFSVPFAWRVVYWVGLGWGGYACYRPIAGAVVRAGRALDLPEPACWIAACLIATVPMTMLVWFVGRLPGPFTPPSLEAAFAMYGYVLVIGGTLTAIFFFIDRHKQQAALAAGAGPAPVLHQDPQVSAAPQPRFFARIPARLGIELVALEMEDHYLRVHTRLGSDLILLRMRDAVTELDGLDGAQVHRSWWVARGAVSSIEREGRNLRLKLAGGLEVPVARDAVGKLKEAGWL